MKTDVLIVGSGVAGLYCALNLPENKNIIVVEEVSINNSDIEIMELHVHLISEKIADEFKKKKRYRTVPTEHGEVLFPPFKLKISDTVTFGLKSFLGIKSLSYKGIKA